MSSAHNTHSHHHHHHHHQYPHDYAPATDDHSHHEAHLQPLIQNLPGALIFYTYIALALTFTTIIVLRLRHLYTSTPPSHRHPSASTPKLALLTLLAFLSFGTLSYHMSHYLILNYTTYSTTHLRPIAQLAHIHLSSGMFLPGPAAIVQFLKAVAAQVWSWSCASELFTSFTVDLVRTPGAQMWTCVSLLGSLGVAMWVVGCREEGGVRRVGFVWFVGLSQILPVGFVLWLVLLGCLLGRGRREGVVVEKEGVVEVRTGGGGGGGGGGSSSVSLVAVGVLFGLCLVTLGLLPSYTGRWQFIPMVLLVRFLLLAPLILPSLTRGVSAMQVIGMVVLIVAIPIAKAGLSHGWRWWWEALNSNPAVSALGYDLLIGVVGLLLFGLLGGLQPDIDVAAARKEGSSG